MLTLLTDCDESCAAKHAEEGSAGSVPHGRVCPALQQFAPLKKYGKGQMAVLRLVLEVLARRHSTDGGTRSCAGGTRSSRESGGVGGHSGGRVGYSDVGSHSVALFDALEHHLPRRTPKEAAEWARTCTVFRRAVGAAPWWLHGDGKPLHCGDDELHTLVRNRW